MVTIPSSLVLCIICLASVNLSSTVDMSIVRSGRYQIMKCNAGQPDSMASKLQAILPRIWVNLQEVIAETEKGTSSSHGYSAFFKSNDSIQTVQAIYQRIARGDFVSIAADGNSQGRNINTLNLAPPSFVCVQEGDPALLEYWLSCTTGPLAGQIIAGIAQQFIVLCPMFWTLPEMPNIGNCPRVRRNTLTPNDDTLISNQQSRIVDVLSTLYGVEPTAGLPEIDWEEATYEPYLIQDAVAQDTDSSVRNPHNFAYYYAGTLRDRVQA